MPSSVQHPNGSSFYKNTLALVYAVVISLAALVGSFFGLRLARVFALLRRPIDAQPSLQADGPESAEV